MGAVRRSVGSRVGSAVTGRFLAVLGGAVLILIPAVLLTTRWPDLPLVRPTCDRTTRPLGEWAVGAGAATYGDYELLNVTSQPDNPPAANVGPWACESVSFRRADRPPDVPRDVYVVAYDNSSEAELAFERYRGARPPFDFETDLERRIGCAGDDFCRVHRLVGCTRLVVAWSATPSDFEIQTDSIVSTLPRACLS